MSELFGLVAALVSAIVDTPQISGPLGVVLFVWLRTRRLQAVGAISKSLVGVAAVWAAGVYTVKNWPLLAPWLRVAARVVLGAVTCLVLWFASPAQKVQVGLLVAAPVALFGIIKLGEWLDGKPPSGRHLQAAWRRDRVVDAMTDALSGLLNAGPVTVIGAAELDGRITVEVVPPVGASIGDIQRLSEEGVTGNAINRICRRYGVGDIHVSSSFVETDSSDEGHGKIHASTGGDPLKTPWDLPAGLSTGVNDPIVVGRTELLTDLTVSIEEEFAMLVGGLRGSGKSGFFGSVLCQLAGREHTALVLLDPKRVEFAGWSERASTVGLGPGASNALLGLVFKEYKRRTKAIETADGFARKGVVGPGWPRIVVVVDELAELDAKAQDKLRQIVTLSRATNISVLTATQRPSTAVVTSDLRDNMDLSVAFATKNYRHTEMVLGEAQTPAHLIPKSLPGVGYAIAQDGRTPVRFRAPWVDDDRIVETAAATAHLAVDLGWPRVIREEDIPGNDDEDGSGHVPGPRRVTTNGRGGQVYIERPDPEGDEQGCR